MIGTDTSFRWPGKGRHIAVIALGVSCLAVSITWHFQLLAAWLKVLLLKLRFLCWSGAGKPSEEKQRKRRKNMRKTHNSGCFISCGT